MLFFLLFTNIPVFEEGYGKAKYIFADGVGPALKILKIPARSAGFVLENYVDLIDVKKQNEELKKKIEALELENQKIPEMDKENERLKGLLSLVERQPNELIAARIVGEDVINWFKCVIIDKGRYAGIKTKMPVITPLGVVGQAVEVHNWHTKVMVVNDTNSAIDVYVSGKDARGIAEGTGSTTLKLRYVTKNDAIEVGDKLITSGKDAIFPKGLAVGIVINVNKNKAGLFSDIDVMPFNNFKKLDEVLVVKK